MDLPAALTALAALKVHPLGLTVDGSLIVLRLSADEQAAVLADPARREQIVTTLQAHGFLYVTLALDAEQSRDSLEGDASGGTRGVVGSP